MIKADIIADSLSPSGVRLTTFVLTYPRFIHAEFMTHRVFSRNASSSRAIPFKRQIEMIEEELAEPLEYLSNKRGMQGGEAIEEQDKAKAVWRDAASAAIEYATRLNELGVHKQHVNRIIEPFSHITVVCTSTDFDNFFGLRKHYMAQPEIHELANKMYEVYSSNKPVKLAPGEWHLPFVKFEERTSDIHAQIIMSVARCARVSYKNHDGTAPEFGKDMELYNRLLGSQPIHASPAEHQAMATADSNVRSGNFRGWIQYRKTIKHENIENFEPGMFEEDK